MNLCISETLLSEEVVELIVVSISHNEFDQHLLRPDLQLQKKSRSNSLDNLVSLRLLCSEMLGQLQGSEARQTLLLPYPQGHSEGRRRNPQQPK